VYITRGSALSWTHYTFYSRFRYKLYTLCVVCAGFVLGWTFCITFQLLHVARSQAFSELVWSNNLF